MSLNKLSIAAKLWTAVVVLILVLLAVLAGTGINSARINAQVQADFGQLLKKSDLVKQWASYTTLNVNRLQASMLSSDPAVDAFFKGRVADTIGQITELNKAIEAIGLDDEEKAQMAQIGALRQKVLDELATTRKIKEGGDHAAAVAHINGPFDAAIQPYLAALKTYEGLQGRKLEQAQQAAAAERAANTRNAAFVVGVILLGIVAGATYLVRNIRQPLRQTVDFAEQIASGDLTARLAMNRQDEFGAMQTALNTMRDQLVHVVSDVRRGTDNITVASQEIASGNHDLSARTEQTASSLEETAASMEEMSGAIKQAADSARVANQLADVAGASAQRGGEVVGQVVTTMQDINEASRKIGEIISVIDGIAFQTNILALNAAVEAARAGEQGRGFAVVAGEVRNLAQRSAQAAKEIKELINNSVNRVGAGTQLVSQAGETMKEIVENVVRVRDIIGEIASSSAEQAEGVNQINAAIANLDQMTQQNAALVEQSAAAASSMSEQAGQLSQVVQTFRLNPADLQNSGIAPQAAAPRSAAKAARPAAAPRVSAPAPAPTRLAKPAARPVPAAPAAPATPARLPRAAAPATSAQGDTGEWESF